MPPTEGLRHRLLNILDEAMAVGGACCGNVQIYNATSGALEIVAHRGLPADVAELWRVVHTSAGTVCARAWREKRRVCVPALAEDPLFAPYLPTAERLGLRAVQSTPLPGPTQPVGVISTHFATSQYPSTAEMVVLDHWAEHARRVLEDFAAA